MLVAFDLQGEVKIEWLWAAAYDNMFSDGFYVYSFSVTTSIRAKEFLADTSRGKKREYIVFFIDTHI